MYSLFRRKRQDSEMDITPMVDVVFLLLIFFMVTAAFGLQKSIAIPDPESEESAQQAKMPEDKDTDESTVINVTKENRVFVESDEAATQQELYAKLREHQYRSGQRQRLHLLVLADAEAMHETVVRVLDAASGVGADSVRLKTEGGE